MSCAQPELILRLDIRSADGKPLVRGEQKRFTVWLSRLSKIAGARPNRVFQQNRRRDF